MQYPLTIVNYDDSDTYTACLYDANNAPTYAGAQQGTFTKGDSDNITIGNTVIPVQYLYLDFSTSFIGVILKNGSLADASFKNILFLAEDLFTT